MKILNVIPAFTPSHGGTVTVLYRLSAELTKLGHTVTIICSDFNFDAKYAKSIEKLGVRVIPFHCTLSIASFRISFSMKKWLKEHIDNFDIIHLHDFRSYQTYVAARYAIKRNIPYILQPHNSMPTHTGKARLKSVYDILMGRPVLDNMSKLIAVSREEVAYSVRLGIPPEKISQIYSGIDVDTKLSKKQPFGLFRQKFDIKGAMILYLGRINKTKGIDILIKSFYLLSREIGDVTLVIAGLDDGFKSNLEKMIDDLGLDDKVRLTGVLNDFDKISAYVDADVFIHAVAYMGGVGLTPLEALVCGTPVIVTKECGEIIDAAHCGYFVQYGDVEDLKDKIFYVLNNPEEARATVIRGTEYLNENLSWENIARRVEQLYENVICNL
jgi:glycosyltransferase involved in cell wall biosynthesis